MSTNTTPDTRPAIAPDRPGHYETRDGGDALVCIPPVPLVEEAIYVVNGWRRCKDRSDWWLSIWTANGAISPTRQDRGDLIRYLGPKFRERGQESPEQFRITGLGTYRNRAGHQVQIIRHEPILPLPWFDSGWQSYTDEGRCLLGCSDLNDIVSRVDEPEPAPVLGDREAEVNTPQPAPDALERLESRVAYLLTSDQHTAERLEALDQWREVFRDVTSHKFNRLFNQIDALDERLDELAARVAKLEGERPAAVTEPDMPTQCVSCGCTNAMAWESDTHWRWECVECGQTQHFPKQEPRP